MKDIYVELALTCRCGSAITATHPVPQTSNALAEFHYSCNKCDTKFFCHIQEVKKDE